MTIYGTPNNEIHDDGGNEIIKARILAKFPDSEILDRAPVDYESYTYGAGYVLDTVQQGEYESELTRIEEHKAEKIGFLKKTIEEKEKWIKARLNETTLDDASKVALGKIFRRLIAFTD